MTFTGSELPEPSDARIKTQYSGSFPLTPGGHDVNLMILLPGCASSSDGATDQSYSVAYRVVLATELVGGLGLAPAIQNP